MRAGTVGGLKTSCSALVRAMTRHVWRQDKGQAVHTGGASPIAMEELSEVGKAVAGVEKGLG